MHSHSQEKSRSTKRCYRQVTPIKINHHRVLWVHLLVALLLARFLLSLAGRLVKLLPAAGLWLVLNLGPPLVPLAPLLVEFLAALVEDIWHPSDKTPCSMPSDCEKAPDYSAEPSK